MTPTIAAGMVETPLTGRPPKPAIPACSAPDGNAAAVGPSGAGGARGWDAQASPAVHHQLPCMVPHGHVDRFERLACEEEHRAVMARLAVA